MYPAKLNPKIARLIKQENKRQRHNINLIASENFTSKPVRNLCGSLLINKYCEGVPGARYYNGCEIIDKIENLAIKQLKKIFNCYCKNTNCRKANYHANVQPHSGSQANMAAYFAVLQPGSVFLGMDLNSGGHLTHGHPVNFSGRFYRAIQYGVDPVTGIIDYDQVQKLAIKYKPKLIVCGASSYSLEIDFARFRKIADSVGALLMADIAHITGLIIAKLHMTPVCYADIITLTTHKTLRGPRGGAILCIKKLQSKIDKAVFPGNQGGPLENIIAAKLQAFYEANSTEFIEYQKRLQANARAMAQTFKDYDYIIVAGKTDNHMLTVDVKNSPCQMTGKKAVEILAKINIIANKNTIPNDKESPWITSGVRFGTPAMTTYGLDYDDFKNITLIIIEAWKQANKKQKQHDRIAEFKKLRHEVKKILKL